MKSGLGWGLSVLIDAQHSFAHDVARNRTPAGQPDRGHAVLPADEPLL